MEVRGSSGRRWKENSAPTSSFNVHDTILVTSHKPPIYTVVAIIQKVETDTLGRKTLEVQLPNGKVRTAYYSNKRKKWQVEL